MNHNSVLNKSAVGDSGATAGLPNGGTLFQRTNRPSRVFCLLAAFCLLPARAALADETRTARERIESMTADEKRDLAQCWERFAALQPDEQERLRRLHGQIEQDPNAAELREVMQRYYEWLKTLPPYVRADLLELPAAERVKRIKELQQQQQREQSRRLGTDDAKVLLKWMEAVADRYESQVLKSLPKQQRQRLESLGGSMRRRAIMMGLWMRWQSGKPGEPPQFLERDLAELRSKLSENARRNLDSLVPPEQWRLVGGWIRQVMKDSMFSRRRGRSAPSVDEEKLADFFEHDLTAKQRDRLLSLPAEQMQPELWRLYMAHLRGSDAPPRRPGDSRHAQPRFFDGPHGPPRPRPEFSPDFRPRGRRPKGKAERTEREH